ncbi:uncharacterized protein LOC131879418 [Tigriopus californicus]|uniref:uncharacterized protein LOC131879418 n=1 Tax=Tigriopus californicus TaxID=6832 RepID=UPI0027DA1467|nr:uncharacterized protein LOC131879418 [Tigriopus californicus]
MFPQVFSGPLIVLAISGLVHLQSVPTTSQNDSSSSRPTSGILIVGGNGGTSSVETIHLGTTSTDQGELNGDDVVIQDYPLTIADAVGGWLDNRAVICGGFCRLKKMYYNDCYSMDPLVGNWSQFEAMPEARAGAAVVVIGKKLFITGGETEPFLITKSTVVWNGSTWESGPDLPMPLTEHCAVQLDEKTTLIAGGRQQNNNDPLLSRRSWIYDWASEKWTEVGPMNWPRIDHSCAIVADDNGIEVGAIGGTSSLNAQLTSPELQKMETFDLKSNTWSLKNQPLPVIQERVIWGSTLSNLDGKLILIGGQDLSDRRLKSMFEYSRHFGFKWVSTTMSTRRSGHVAIVMGEPSPPTNEGQKANLATLPDFILVGGGQSDSVPLAEILSFRPSTKMNDNDAEITNFPTQLLGATGQEFQGKATVCGGLDLDQKMLSSKCFHWDNSRQEWVSLSNLALGRKGAASIVFEGKLWVLGGESQFQIEHTTEILGEDGLWSYGPDLPFGLSDLCAVVVDSKSFMVIGGTQREVESNSLQSRHVWLYNASSPSSPWEELAPLQVKRMNHACGTFMADGRNKRVIVAGGDNRDRTTLSNVRHPEWFDFEAQEWVLSQQTIGGSHDLGLIGADMVESDGRLFLLGGTDLMGRVFRNIYEYQEEFGFHDVEAISMAHGRYDFVALSRPKTS